MSSKGWGKPGDELLGYTLSRDDPNYDSEEEYAKGVVMVPVVEPAEEARHAFVEAARTLREYKTAVRAALLEYLDGHDRAELVRIVRALGGIVFRQEIARCALDLAVRQGGDAHGRLAAVLQHLFEHGLVTAEQVQHGLALAVDRLHDLRLDVPSADEDARRFVSRAAAGEVLSEAAAAALARSIDAQTDPEAARAAKAAVRRALDEYFESEDLAELARTVAELDAPQFHHEVVKAGVLMAMDRTDRERELLSYAVDALSGDPSGLVAAEVEKGFRVLLERVDDIYNDVPLVLQLLSCFLARGVAQESVAPAFLDRTGLLPSDMGMQVVRQARVLLRDRHNSSRLERVWGPGDGRSVGALKKAVRDLVNELYLSGDVAEAVKCVRELRAPYFAHEVVLRLVARAVDLKEREERLAVQLLRELVASEAVSPAQVAMGFDRLDKRIADLALDAPNAAELVKRVREAVSAV